MPAPTEAAAYFATGLTEKLGTTDESFDVAAGRAWDKIVVVREDQPVSVHAFVNRETGNVHKAEGFNKPVTSPRYPSVYDALAAADRFGGYLYAH